MKYSFVHIYIDPWVKPLKLKWYHMATQIWIIIESGNGFFAWWHQASSWTSVYLSLFYKNAHPAAMVKHALMEALDSSCHLNPDQFPVIVRDPPLYCIAKQMQWSLSDTPWENQYVVMLGELHMMMAVLRILVQWLNKSGLAAVLVQAGVTTAGKAEALITASHVNHIRCKESCAWWSCLV